MFNLFFILSQIREKLLLIIIVIILNACTKNVLMHGFIFNNKDIDQLSIGYTSEEKVLELLGTPTTESEFGEQTWYYISSRSERRAFFKPIIIERRILVLTFDKNRIINDITEYSLNNDDFNEFSKESTAIEGDDTRVLKQFIENIGRFNKKGKRVGAR